MPEYVLALDIGGTKTIAGLVTEKGEISTSYQRKTHSSLGAGSVVDAVCAVLDDVLAGCSRDGLRGFGVATAGWVSRTSGNISYATDAIPGWNGFPLKQVLWDRYGIEPVVINDGHAAAVAEYVYGEAKGCGDMVVLTIGTGIGGGVITGGRLLDGQEGLAGSLGHICVDPNGLACPCGSRGCLEMYVSGTALAREAKERGILGPAGLAAEGPVLLDMAKAGDPGVLGILEQAGEKLGLAISMLARVLNMNKVVLAGGAADFWEFLEPACVGELEQRAIGPAASISIVKTVLGPEAVMLGAAGTVWHETLRYGQ
jgi:glucokinase